MKSKIIQCLRIKPVMSAWRPLVGKYNWQNGIMNFTFLAHLTKGSSELSELSVVSLRHSCPHCSCRKLFTFSSSSLSRTTGPSSTKFGTKHPWVMGIQVCLYKGPHPFPRGNNYEITKIHWKNFKIFSRTTGTLSTKLGTKHPWVMRSQVYSNEGPCLFQGVIITK